jgi:hypothetical protein
LSFYKINIYKFIAANRGAQVFLLFCTSKASKAGRRGRVAERLAYCLVKSVRGDALVFIIYEYVNILLPSGAHRWPTASLRACVLGAPKQALR